MRSLSTEQSQSRVMALLDRACAASQLVRIQRPPILGLRQLTLASHRRAHCSTGDHARQRAPLVGDRVVALYAHMLCSAIGSAHHIHVPLDTHCRASPPRHAHIRQSPPLPCRCHGDVSYISLLFRSESPSNHCLRPRRSLGKLPMAGGVSRLRVRRVPCSKGGPSRVGRASSLAWPLLETSRHTCF